MAFSEGLECAYRALLPRRRAEVTVFESPGYHRNYGNCQFGEEAMKRKCVNWVVLTALVGAAAVGERGLSSGLFSAQAAQQGRSLPIFEVDRAWPDVPAQWK